MISKNVIECLFLLENADWLSRNNSRARINLSLTLHANPIEHRLLKTDTCHRHITDDYPSLHSRGLIIASIHHRVVEIPLWDDHLAFLSRFRPRAPEVLRAVLLELEVIDIVASAEVVGCNAVLPEDDILLVVFGVHCYRLWSIMS